MAAPLRLADLLASVSLLSDLGFALPPEESMRSCLVATALARRLGLGEADVADAFYTALLQHVGCIGFAHETSTVYGDEMVANAAAARTVTTDLSDVLDTFIRATARGRGPVDWARVVAYTLVRGDQFGRRFAAARCEVGSETARRLGLSDGVRRGLRDVAESWDGSGGFQGRRGDDIALAARVACVAATASRFHHLGGTAAAVDAVRRGADRLLDPAMARTFVEEADGILGQAHAGDPRDALLDAEPPPVRIVTTAELPEVAAAVAGIADLKSTWTLGHASRVAELAASASGALGLDVAATSRVRVAGLLHDLGRVGISSAIWDRPGPLTAAEWEQVRLHPYHTERILARSDAFLPMAALAGAHHERLDGSGYHRGSHAREIPIEARVLAAADAVEAMTRARPHRPALSEERVAALVREEGRAGRLDPDAVEAVLGVIGLASPSRARRTLPAGLSDREVEVLRLVARGLSNREVAARLVVSPRTAEHHVQHIYTKIGVSSRAAAALFAMEHGLLD